MRVSSEPCICLADCVVSGLSWHDVCSYFEEDELLHELRPCLLESHSADGLGSFLYKVWLLASEEQFGWFISTFEHNLQNRDDTFFGKALENFSKLCDAHI